MSSSSSCCSNIPNTLYFHIYAMPEGCECWNCLTIQLVKTGDVWIGSQICSCCPNNDIPDTLYLHTYNMPVGCECWNCLTFPLVKTGDVWVFTQTCPSSSSCQCQVQIRLTWLGTCARGIEVTDGVAYSIGCQYISFTSLSDPCDCVSTILVNGSEVPYFAQDGEELNVTLVPKPGCGICTQSVTCPPQALGLFRKNNKVFLKIKRT